MKTTQALKAILKRHQNSPRNYATVLAVWSAENNAWSHTNGYTVIGHGEVGTEPENLITLKDLEFHSLDDLHSPLLPHHAARRPAVMYPKVKTCLDAMPKETEAKFVLNIEFLEDMVKSLKSLGGKGQVKIEVKKDTVHFEKDGYWGMICKAAVED